MKKYLSLLLLVVLFASCGWRSPSQRRAEAKGKENTVNVLADSRTPKAVVEVIARIPRLSNETQAVHLEFEGEEYIIIVSFHGCAIVDHNPESQVRTVLNMDSVVANNPWIDEYSMLGYTKAEPSKESLESLTNPKVRPASVTI